MPTYRNDSNETLALINTNGAQKYVKPGYSIESYIHYDISGLTKTAASPYYNPVYASTHILSGEQEVDINSDTKTIILINDSDTIDVDVYWDSTENTPATPLTKGTWSFPDIQDKVQKLIFSYSGELSSGECMCIQMGV
jgi:hypothetical protein